ncbi:hypothetical protein NP493_378g00033 [Ridgeia piscesae]|uniref:Uncharacterized protein n=1 Tax=Ridgeia piscesae TaxID=27915 RepID=A0AAD9NTJ5_RIDPI|nr:hypothetical protein NP493_378g00033 [Ridgeia piscesae]
MNDARAHFYRGHKKPPPLKKLPPTDANLQLHVLRAHLQMLLWKVADQRDPPVEARNISQLWLEYRRLRHYTGRLNSASCSPNTP